MDQTKCICTRKRIFLVFNLMLTGLISTAQDEIEKLPEYPIKTISNYCQGDTSKLISQETITYNENKLPVQSILTSNLNKQIFKKFIYDKKKRISRVFTFLKENDGEKEISTVTYKYDSKGNLIYYAISKLSDTIKIIKYEYVKGKLSRKSVSGKDWSVSYTYQYDGSGRLIHQDKDSTPYQDFNYDQSGKLIKVIQHTNESPLETVYNYDMNGSLSIKEMKGKTLEKNIYKDGRIKEQRFSDYSPDSSIELPCGMKTIKRFEYIF